MKDERNERFVQNIKDIGQALIDNAETIVDYKYLRDLTITCYILDNDQGPYIHIDTEYYPEGWIKRYS